MPAAFLRRCVVLSLAPEGDYQDWLVKRGEAHFGMPDKVKIREREILPKDVLIEGARQLVQDRAALESLNPRLHAIGMFRVFLLRFSM